MYVMLQQVGIQGLLEWLVVTVIWGLGELKGGCVEEVTCEHSEPLLCFSPAGQDNGHL